MKQKGKEESIWREPVRQKSTYVYVARASATKVDLCICGEGQCDKSRLMYMWRGLVRQKSTYVYFDGESQRDECRLIYMFNMAKASATCVDLDKCTVMFLFYSSVIWEELRDVPRPGSLLHASARVCLLAYIH